MAVYLVQHGKSLPKAQDPEKGLSSQGLNDVRRIAEVAGGYGVKVDRIIHSGKKRALQTAEILAEILKPAEGVHSVGGIDPLDDVAAFAGSLEMQDNLMIVGHLPFLEKLAAYLITGQDQFAVFELQNGGILCIGNYRDTRRAAVKWALMPEVN